MRNRMYGGVRGRKTKVGGKLLRFPPTRFFVPCQCGVVSYRANAALFRRAGGALPLRSRRCYVASAMLFVLAVWVWGLRAVLPSVLQPQAQ